MMKSLLAANRSEKDSFRIPHSVQQSIPIRRIYTDGIWQVGQKYSKTWRFSDVYKRQLPVAAQVRAIFPVLAGISGSTNTTCSM